MSDPTRATGEAARDVDLDAIERAARAATSGPWRADGAHVGRDDSAWSACKACDPNDIATLYDGEYIENMNGDNDAAFIATLDPPTALALVARVRSAEAERGDALARVKELEGLARDCIAMMHEMGTHEADLDARTFAECHALLADAARLLAGKDGADG